MRCSEYETLSRRLPARRRTFHFFRDRHALILLALHVGEGRRVSDVKASPLAGLLRRPVVREVLAKLSGDTVRVDDLLAVWPRESHTYVVSLGVWGSERKGWCRCCYQTTRKGLNLVVRLNFNREHDRDFARLMRAKEWHDPSRGGHPVDTDGRNTLAWVRVDLDLESRTALIEEVQSDWVRDARAVHDAVVNGRTAWAWRWSGCQGAVDERRVRDYQRYVLGPHLKTWAESALTAAIVLLVKDLGIRSVYYHTFGTGMELKEIDRRHAPPRSLYTDLPRRFAFRETDQAPPFLWENADGHTRYVLSRSNARFHVHEWGEDAVREVAGLLE